MSIARRSPLATGHEPAAVRARQVAAAISSALQSADDGAPVARVVRERLLHDGIEVSQRQVYRYLARYRAGGSPGLVDKRSVSVDRRWRSVDPGIFPIIEDELARLSGKSTGTRSRLIARVLWRAKDAGLNAPSTRTMYRLVAELDRGRASFGLASTREQTSNRPDRPYRRSRPTRPGELVELDSTPLDVLCVFPDGSVARPELTYGIDVATSSICGTLLLPRATRGADVAGMLLARVVVPAYKRPGWQHSLSVLSAALPRAETMVEEYVTAVGRQPTIVPESLTIDRGKIYTGSTFAAACELFGISQVIAAPGTPTDKPHVEGGFLRLRDGFVQYLNGYTGGSTAMRGKGVVAETVWRVDEVQVLLDAWIALIWQTTPQSGLRIAGLQAHAMSPNQMYEVLSAAAPQLPIEWDEDTFIELMPRVWRGVHPYGINLNGLVYDADALHAMRGRRSGLGGEARDRWEVRFDPADATRIWLHDHRRQSWIEATWVHANRTTAQVTVDQVRVARRVLNSEQPPSGIDILAEIERAQSGRVARSRAESTTRPAPPPPPRLVGIGGLAGMRIEPPHNEAEERNVSLQGKPFRILD